VRSEPKPKPQRAIYLKLADRLLSQFRPIEGTDPKVFLTAITSVMMQYPIEIVEKVVDPVAGLPAQQPFTPTPYDVKTACDKLMQPVFGRMDAYDTRSRAQLEERKQFEDASRRDPDKAATVRKFEDEMASYGIHMEGWKKRQERARSSTAPPPPSAPSSSSSQHGDSPHRNLFYPEEGPQYAAILERTRTAPAGDYCFGTSLDGQRRGVWVPRVWHDKPTDLGAWKPLVETPETVRAKFNLTPEQWDAIPNAPPRAS
jgi:hypothetical protein